MIGIVSGIVLWAVLVVGAGFVIGRAARNLVQAAEYIASSAEIVTRGAEELADAPRCPLNPLPCPTCTPERVEEVKS